VLSTGETAISNKVFVGNLSFDVTREELMEAFSAAGKVVDAKLPTDRETGRPRGFAFVEFEDDEAAEKSIQLLNGRELRGRPIRVNEADNRPPRPGGPGGGGGGFGGPRPGGGGHHSGPRPPAFTGGGGDSGFGLFDDRGRPMKTKGSRRNIRRRKRGFD
jgi:cold-inducible RNA-binding protein